MNKIKFINRIGKTLRDHRVKPADFFALALIAELCAAHKTVTVYMLAHACYDPTIRRHVYRLLNEKLILETEELPQNLDHDCRTQIAYKPSALGITLLQKCLEPKIP